MSELKQTKGTVKLRGIIVGKDEPKNSNGYKEGKTKETKTPYRTIKFLIKTSPTNIVPVELFGQIREKANWFSKSEKTNMQVLWAKRNNVPPDGYALIKPEYDLIEEINSNFKDGDSVVVIAEPQYSIYTTNDESRQQTKYVIKKFFKVEEPIDFGSEKFKEENFFTQEIVVKETVEDKTEKKLFVHANIILYGEKSVSTTFEVDLEKDKEFAKNMKTLKMGDFVKVNGLIEYRAVVEENAESNGWGTKSKPTTSYKKAMEITGADPETLVKKKYKESDFETVPQHVKTTKNFNEILDDMESNDDSELPFDV